MPGNAHVILQADIAALKRTVAERDARIKALQDEVAKTEPAPAAEATVTQ